MNPYESFYKDKVVLVTGHMGFKGTWLCHMLNLFGAKVIGYGIMNDVRPSIYEISGIEKDIVSLRGDVRDLPTMKYVFKEYQPEIVFHLAAQPIVLTSYKEPVSTYETNVLGTVNLMECIRLTDSVKSVVNVTTDKVYKNTETGVAFKEDDVLDGIDPYANSKSCSELVTWTYVRSFFEDRDIAVSTVRAGNVIGGGDFSDNRIVPDCIRAQAKDGHIDIRNPKSVRPFQHVLEALFAYVTVAMRQMQSKELASSYNVGPKPENSITAGELCDIFCREWGENATWDRREVDGPRESLLLRLNCTKIKDAFGIEPVMSVEDAVKLTIKWEKKYETGEVMYNEFREEIKDFMVF